MPYGSLGYLSTWTNPQDFASLPDWLRRQIVPTNQDESTTTYGFGQGLFDQSGRQVSQLSPNAYSQGADGSLIDPSAVWNDEALGDVTGTENLRHVQSASFRNGLLATQLAIAAMTGYGAYSALGGAGAANPFAGAVAEGSIDGAAASPFAGAVAEGSVSNAPWVPGSNPFEGAVGEGAVSDAPWVPGSSPGLLDGLADQFTNNPLQTLARGYSLLSMGRGLIGGNRNSNTSNNDNSGDKGGGVTNVTPYQRAPYQPNPFTQSQIQNFRYTGR